MTKRSAAVQKKSEEENREMKLQPPKFFAPSAKNEAGNALANMLTSFSLNANHDEAEAHQSTALASPIFRLSWSHLGQFFALVIGLWFWSHTFRYPDENSFRVLVMVLSGCFTISTRTLFGPFFAGPGQGQVSPTAQRVAVLLGAVGCVASGWELASIATAGVEKEGLEVFGTTLIAGMILQEFWWACFR